MACLSEEEFEGFKDHDLSLSSFEDYDAKSFNCSKSSSMTDLYCIQDKYIVTSEVIGQGAFAKVVLGFCKATNERVAIKKIDKRITQEKNLLERVQSEAAIHLQVSSHKNVVKFKDLFEDDYFLYFVLELCECGDLRSYLTKQNQGKSCRCSENDIRQFLLPIVEVLNLLHENDIVHRDLSLSNVLVSKDLKCKLSDFGLAIKLDKNKENGGSNRAFCGTPNYIAPELIRDKIYRKESDIWSLGVMFYTVLAGKEPFDGQDRNQTFKNILSMNVKSYLPENTSKEAHDLLNKTICLDYKKRLTPKEILNHAFFWKTDIRSEFSSDSGRETLSSACKPYRPSIYTDSIVSQPTQVETTERTKPEKISTVRLKPIKSHNKDTIIEIRKDSYVVLHVQRRSGRGYDVFQVSPDGEQINIFTTKTPSAEDSLHCPPSSKSYTYDSLPVKYWQRYAYVTKFVRIVRSGTPKVTVYTEKAKCKLMESLDDYEAIFQDGTKISGNLSKDEIRIIESDGKQYNELPARTKDKWKYVCDLLKECHFIESSFRKRKSEILDYFPVRVGANVFVTKNSDGVSSACF